MNRSRTHMYSVSFCFTTQACPAEVHPASRCPLETSPSKRKAASDRTASQDQTRNQIQADLRKGVAMSFLPIDLFELLTRLQTIFLSHVQQTSSKSDTNFYHHADLPRSSTVRNKLVKIAYPFGFAAYVIFGVSSCLDSFLADLQIFLHVLRLCIKHYLSNNVQCILQEVRQSLEIRRDRVDKIVEAVPTWAFYTDSIVPICKIFQG